MALWGVISRAGFAHRPSVDHQEGFGGAVEGAGRQGVRFSRNDVAQIIVRMGWFAEGELGDSFILVIEQVLQRVKKIT